MPLPHIIQECPAVDSQEQYTAKPILPLVLAELNSYEISSGYVESCGWSPAKRRIEDAPVEFRERDVVAK